MACVALRGPRAAFEDALGEPRAGINGWQPELVAQVGFTRMDPYRRLRHPRFLGLRDGKSPGVVVREAARGPERSQGPSVVL